MMKVCRSVAMMSKFSGNGTVSGIDDVLVGHPGTGVSHQQCTPGATILLAAAFVSVLSTEGPACPTLSSLTATPGIGPRPPTACEGAAMPLPPCAAAEAVVAGG
eukprot:2117424-Lingulodinium_polyedra.AAC.1